MAEERSVSEQFLAKEQTKVMVPGEIDKALAMVAKAGSESFVAGTQPDTIAKIATAIFSGGLAYLRFNAATLARRPENAIGTVEEWADNASNYTFTIEIMYSVPGLEAVEADGDTAAQAATDTDVLTLVLRLRANYAARLFSTESGDSFFVKDGGSDSVELVDTDGVGNVYQISRYAFEEPFTGGLAYPGQYYELYDKQFSLATKEANAIGTNRVNNRLTTEARREIYTKVNDFINRDNNSRPKQGVIGINETVAEEYKDADMIKFIGDNKPYMSTGKFIVNKAAITV